jgi:membrane-bound serine protease (ClpP class)
MARRFHCLGAMTIAFLVAGACLSWAQAPSASARPVAVVAEVDGIVHPITAEFMTEVMDRADTSGAVVVIFVLRTPGGLLDSTRTIVSRMIAARTPVVMFVAPSGARAASAGFILMAGADVAVMAPGTHIGAAHPVSGTDQKPSEAVEKKAAADVAAYARSLAEARGRNVQLSAAAVTESRAFTDREALEAAPPLIDFVAKDVADVLRQLDGRSVTRFDGRTQVLHTGSIEIARAEMSRRQQFLGAIAHPQIAYLLLSLGILGLTVELWNPGAILPGVAGGLCLLLAFFALQVLPVNTTGVLLIVFGVGLLLLELKVPSFGVLGIGGAASLLVGSIMVTREVPGVSVGLGLIIPVVLTMAGIILFLGRLALAAQRRPPVSGVDGMVGAAGRALQALEPGTPGQVTVHGEIWQGVASVPIVEGQPVRVAAIDGLTLTVRPDPPSPHPAGGHP